MRRFLGSNSCPATAAVLLLSASSLYAQNGNQGSVQLTVQDSSGAVIPQANLELVNTATNDTRKATTDGKGTYGFVNLNIGTYRLTITKAGFATQIFDKVIVQAAVVNGLDAVLPVGGANDTVRVEAESIPVLETSSNQVGQVVDMKQIEDLPLQGRDLTAFSRLTAGWTGTYNGLPSPDSGNNIDGSIGTPSRGKYGNGGATQASVSPRVESIEQMSVQTDQLDLGSGFGQATNQINYVSRRGSNQFHFRAYYDYRNSGLNTTSWTLKTAGQRKPKLILHDFGISAGGPILHNNLFVFGTFASSRQPSGAPVTNSVFSAGAQQGNFTYTGTDRAQHTVNVFDLARTTNSALPTTLNTTVASQLALINKNASAGLTPSGDPELNTISFVTPAPITRYFPAVRFDYNVSEKLRMYLSVLATTADQPSGTFAPPFPGSDFANQNAGYYSRNLISTFGLDYTISPRMINQVKVGYLYAHTENAFNVAPLYASNPVVYFNFPGDASNANKMSGWNYTTPSGNFYPVYSASDTVSLDRHGHTLQFGGSWYREQDHYYNNPVGFPTLNLGLATGDPALQAFTSDNATARGSVPFANAAQVSEAQQLYAVLTGCISSISGSYPYNRQTQSYQRVVDRYNLNELSNAWALFAQDSWKVTSNLTLDYGLRWDFIADNHDLTGAYHSALPDSIYGPTAPGDLFKPGTLNGNQNPALTGLAHTYKPYNITPQPALGFAWNPKTDGDGLASKLLGNGGTVIRGGFSFRRFTEPYQFFWDAASNYGTTFYQFFGASANTTGKVGTYAPGSVALGGTLPAYVYTPTSVADSMPMSQFTFVANSPGVNGMDPNIRQPYVEAWNFGVQKQLGASRVLEIRYNGNHTVHQWLQVNPNEVNVFENGFLSEFQRAQGNLAANGGKSFSDVGRGPANATPILDAAFGGAGTSTFTSSQFINYLNNGQVGSFANQLAGNSNATPLYYCNLVGTKFAPCATNAGYTTGGAGYPINFFQANPFSGGRTIGYMTDAGYSNYNGLQVEFRQATWHGLELNANYTFSKGLGISSNNQYTAAANSLYTVRNLAMGYGPTLFDVRHVTHVSGTYDLPFGKGRTFYVHNAFADRIIGGWNVGTILTYQTGTPFLLTGNTGTYNNYADGGVRLNGITSRDLQSAVGVHRVAGSTTANLLDPKYLSGANGGTANGLYIAANTTPGTIGSLVYLYGPTAFYDDIAVTKAIPVKEGVNFRIQGEFLNAFNHPVFGNTTGSTTASVTSASFSRAGVTNETNGFGRQIELRANIEF